MPPEEVMSLVCQSCGATSPVESPTAIQNMIDGGWTCSYCGQIHAEGNVPVEAKPEKRAAPKKKAVAKKKK